MGQTKLVAGFGTMKNAVAIADCALFDVQHLRETFTENVKASRFPLRPATPLRSCRVIESWVGKVHVPCNVVELRNCRAPREQQNISTKFDGCA